MKRKANFLSVLFSFTILSSVSYAQMGKEDGSKFGHGDDSIRCLRNLSLCRENVRNREYDYALEYWKLVFDECPKSTRNLYIWGARIYKDQIKKEENLQTRNELIDTLMLIYETRINHFGEKGKVREQQGISLLKYRRNDGVEFLQQGYEYLTEAVELQKEKSSNATLATLMSTSIILYHKNEFDANQVIEDYIKISKLIDKMMAKRPGYAPLEKLKAAIDANFINEGPEECEVLISHLSKEHRKNKENISFLEMLTGILRKKDCTTSELYYVASKDLHALQPTSESAINIAMLARDREEYKEAINYLKQAIELEIELDKTADYYLEISIAHKNLGNKNAARNAAKRAISIRPNFGKPYILIGQLYAESKDECASISLPKARYWAAVDMIKKAKQIDPTLEEAANSLIGNYNQRYPNREKAFFLGINEGDTYKIESWINVTTIARF